jgi:hypothetical protein
MLLNYLESTILTYINLVSNQIYIMLFRLKNLGLLFSFLKVLLYSRGNLLAGTNILNY